MTRTLPAAPGDAGRPGQADRRLSVPSTPGRAGAPARGSASSSCRSRTARSRWPSSTRRACSTAHRRTAPDVVVLDSIAAAFLGPWLHGASRRCRWSACCTSRRAGSTTARCARAVQAWLDRLAYRRARRLLVASDSLAEDLRRQRRARRADQGRAARPRRRGCGRAAAG